jgi:hypothetical protein
MLKTFAIALLATAMSVGLSAGLAQAKGMAKPKAMPACQTEQQAKDNCACGPAKAACQKGMWCHAFSSACTR